MRDITELAGEIRVRLVAEGGRIVAASIVSTRPTEPARIFLGRPVADMTRTIGRVFSLCGTAQTVAALAAAEEATGILVAPSVAAARDAARRAEMVTQIVTRLALHWPRVLGLPLAPGAVRSAMATETAIAAQVLGSGWRVPGAGLAGRGDAVCVAEIDVAALVAPLAERLADRGIEGYGARPEGAELERGVLATYWDSAAVARARARHGAGLAARLAAAQAALLALPAEIRADLAAVSLTGARHPARDSGSGFALVETARGPLGHRLEIAAGKVTLCRTEAPTDRHFAPRGPVAAGLTGAAADPVAAELHVLAIDPCVACRVELAPAP